MSKKIKMLLLLSLAILLSLVVTNSQSISAEKESNNDLNTLEPIIIEKPNSPIIDLENLEILETDGSLTIFDNAEDMENYLNYMESIDDTYTTMAKVGETVVGTQYKKMQFISYSKYTPDWTKASSYTLKKGNTYSFSSKIKSKWGNVSVSFSRKHGVNTNIPANSKKFSKLAGYADLKIQRIKVTLPTVPTFYKTKVTKTNTYIKVKYK